MKPPRPARVPRSGRESRAPREPRAPRSVLPAPGASLPAPGTRWNLRNDSGVGAVFVVLTVIPLAKSADEHVVEYCRRGERQAVRMNLTAFRNRFVPAP